MICNALCQGRLLRPRDRTDGHGWVGIPSRTNLTDASWHAWHLMQSHACSSLAWLGERRSWFQCSRWVSRECLLLVLAILVPGVSVSWLSGNRIDTVWHRVPRRLTQSSSRRGNIFQMQSGTDWRWLTYLFRTVRYCSFLLGVVDFSMVFFSIFVAFLSGPAASRGTRTAWMVKAIGPPADRSSFQIEKMVVPWSHGQINAWGNGHGHERKGRVQWFLNAKKSRGN